MKLARTPAVINRALPYYHARNGRLTRLGGQIGTVVGIVSRLAPLAFQAYGKYLMRGGLFGVLADVGRSDKEPEEKVPSAFEASLAKSALLSQLFTVVKTSKKGARLSSLRSALLLAGAQKALPIVADWAFAKMKNRKSAR